MKALDRDLVELAFNVVQLNGDTKIIDLNPGEDYQGELCVAWIDNQFHVELNIFSDPVTTYGGYFDPPETEWREEQESIVTRKIREVEKFVKDFNFSL